MNSRIHLLSHLLFSLLCTACVRYTSSAQSLAPEYGDLTEKVISVETNLNKRASSSFRVGVTRLNPGESLRCVDFLTEKVGWVGGTGGLYVTNDGGRLWERVKIDPPQGAAIIKVYFANSSQGWAVAQKEPANSWEYTENHFWLYQTRDGGQTWGTQVEGENSEVSQIRFASETEGWLVGRKYLGSEPLRAHDFILHTVDQGKHWLDVSEELNQSLVSYDGYVRISFSEILPDGPLAAQVLMPEGRVFRTNNGGQTWQPVSGVIERFNYVWSRHMGVTPEGKLWIAGGKDDRKSALGMFSVKESEGWLKYLLPGVYFSDLLLVTRDQLIATGSMTPNQGMYTDQRYAAVCYSSDGGRNWSIVYRNANVKKINAITEASANIWAVGDGGLILHLDPIGSSASKHGNERPKQFSALAVRRRKPQ